MLPSALVLLNLIESSPSKTPSTLITYIALAFIGAPAIPNLGVGEGPKSHLPAATALDLERFHVIAVMKVDDVGALVRADCVHNKVALIAVGVVSVDGVVLA